jgi:hypothetical protein
MRLRNHLLAIILSIAALIIPSSFGLTSLDGSTSGLWSTIAAIGILTSPGLSFSLFLRKWAKNISDDMSMSLSILISITWILFIYTWQSNQGLTIQHIDILWSTVGVSLLFLLLGILPNGRKLGASEPLQNKIPMFISVFIIGTAGFLALSESYQSEIERNESEPKYNALSVIRQSPESVTIRIVNPSEETARLTVNLSNLLLNTPPFTFTDIISQGATDVTFALPDSGLGECVKYEVSYSIISSNSDYSADGIIVGNAYCQPERVRQPALPTDREDLLNYIFSEGLK